MHQEGVLKVTDITWIKFTKDRPLLAW